MYCFDRTTDCLSLRLRAIGIYVFLKILIGYFGEDGKLLAEMEIPVTFRSPPCCCCCVCMKSSTLNRSGFFFFKLESYYTHFFKLMSTNIGTKEPYINCYIEYSHYLNRQIRFNYVNFVVDLFQSKIKNLEDTVFPTCDNSTMYDAHFNTTVGG